VSAAAQNSSQRFARVAFALTLLGLASGGAAWLAGRPHFAGHLWQATIVLVLLPLALDIAASLRRRELGVDAIALLAMAGALAFGQNLAGAVVALMLSGFLIQQRWWIKVLSLIFILPWALPSIPTILSVRFMLNPEWGVINTLIFRLSGADGPNWLNHPPLALGFSMLMHIWKSLPFWTLILVAGRLAIPAEQYEAASVDGATGWQKFRFITWPSMRTLYLTSTILSMIWTLGDFNSVYLLTGGGPADLTHVLATIGIRYLRLDLVDLAMASIVVALPLVLPLVYFMMKRLSK